MSENGCDGCSCCCHNDSDDDTGMVTHSYNPRDGEYKEVQVPANWHYNFHAIFGNLNPSECQSFLADILSLMRKTREVKKSEIEFLRTNAMYK